MQQQPQQQQVRHPSDWGAGTAAGGQRQRRQATRADFVIALTAAHIAELRWATHILLARLGAPPASDAGSQAALAAVVAGDFPLPGDMGAVLRAVRSELIDGQGLVILDRIPVEELSPAETACLWVRAATAGRVACVLVHAGGLCPHAGRDARGGEYPRSLGSSVGGRHI
jgi:hypothetical protein